MPSPVGCTQLGWEQPFASVVMVILKEIPHATTFPSTITLVDLPPGQGLGRVPLLSCESSSLLSLRPCWVGIHPGGTGGKLQPRWQRGPPGKDHVALRADLGGRSILPRVAGPVPKKAGAGGRNYSPKPCCELAAPCGAAGCALGAEQLSCSLYGLWGPDEPLALTRDNE